SGEAEKTTLAVLCRLLREVAGSSTPHIKIARFSLSRRVALCARLPLFVARKGQEKGNVAEERPYQRRRSSFGKGHWFGDDATAVTNPMTIRRWREQSCGGSGMPGSRLACGRPRL